ncbi:MAG: hypothetical protein WC876_01940 [Candidatus Thermoplasmatota archaeon]|jgi:hypothetical protein
MSPVICRNPACLDPLDRGADHLCDRCYRYERRTGKLPAARRADNLAATLPPVRVTALLLRHATAAARREGVALATWVRRAVEAAVLRGVG